MLFNDNSARLLSQIFTRKDLERINNQYWYFSGKDFIEERDYDISGDIFRFEDTSIEEIKNKVIYELIRNILLLKTK
jgi:hypothetical protein